MRPPQAIRDKRSVLVQLLARVAEGDRAAFARLYQMTSTKLFGVVLRILRREELAEEVLQDVYVRIWENAASFDTARASPISWMATIARNRAIDAIRRRQPDVVEDDRLVENVIDETAMPAQKLEMSDELRRLERCLEGLDEERSKMVRLAYLEGYSRQELAARFGQPLGTIKTWLRRSLIQLRDCLGS